jgi:hypothetical protein
MPHTVSATEKIHPPLEPFPIFHVRYRSESAGTIRWKLPESLARRILLTQSLEHRTAVIFEIQMALATQAETIVGCVSNVKRSEEIGNLLYDIQLKSSYVPELYHCDMYEDEDEDE